MGTPLSFDTVAVCVSSLTIILLYPAVLRSGAQSIIIIRDIRCSNGSNKYKEVGQQYIIKY